MSEQAGRPGGQEFDPTLHERIAQAIAPALADFERQVAQAVEERLAAVPTSSRGVATRSREDPAEQKPVTHTSKPPDVLPPAPDPDDAAPPRGAAAHREPERDGKDDEALVPMLRKVVHGLERESGDWIQSLLANGLDALFSDQVRAAVQEQLNRSTRVLTDDIFAGIIGGAEAEKELENRTERLIQGLLDDLLRNLFEGSLRQEVEYHTDEAVRALTRLDLDAGAHHIQEALEALVLGIVKVLGRHWGDVLKLLLKIVVEYLQDTASSAVSEGFAGAVDIVASSVEAEEKGEAVQEQFEEKTNELGEKLREASETLRERIAESSEQLQSRLKAGRDGETSNHQLGRPPRGRQLGRAPTGRPPPGPGRSRRR